MKKRILSLALALIMLLSLVPMAAMADENPFKDVAKTTNGKANPFYEAILWAVGEKITTGYDDNTFRPNNTCTRGHVVTFLYRAAGSPALKSTKNPFKDVKESSPFYKAILWAAENGITTGYSDGTFKPDQACTRAHVVTFLWRFENKPDASGSVNLKDLKGLNADFSAAIKWAATSGITTGYSDNTFRPNDICTRAHVVTFLYRDIKNNHVHTWGDPVVTKHATETAAGEKTRTCSGCGKTMSEAYYLKASLVTETTTYSDGSQLIWAYTNDEFGNMVSGIAKDEIGLETGTMSVSYFDAKNGHIKEATIESFGQYIFTRYNEKANDIEYKVAKDGDTVISELKNSFDENGRMTLSEETNSIEGVTSVEKFFYNDKGKLAKEELTVTDADGNSISTDITYKYNSDNKVTSKSSTIEQEGIKLTLKIDYTYDKNGNLSKMVQKISNISGVPLGFLGDSLNLVTYTYKYALYGSEYLLTEEKAEVNEELGSLMEGLDGSYTIENVYNELGTLLKMTQKDGDGNVVSITEYSYEYLDL